MTELDEREKIRRLIGATLFGVGALCLIWGDLSHNEPVFAIGKTTAVVGIVLYFLGRIGRLLRRK